MDLEYFYKNKYVIDFEYGYQLNSFDIIFIYVRKSYEISTKSGERYEALNFIFNNKKIRVNGHEYRFLTAMRTINLEPEILKIRLCYQLYINCIEINFNKLMINTELSEVFINDILFLNDMSQSLKFLKIKLCRFIYKYPAIKIEQVEQELLLQFPQNEINMALKELLDCGMIGDNCNKLYFIGRNPIKFNRKRFCWSLEWIF